MEIALIGLPNSGKTTVFNALTHSRIDVSGYADPKAEPHVAAVEIEDERVDRLADIYQPKKRTYASVTFIDFAGLQKDPSQSEAFSSTATGLVKNVDALAYVVRNFYDELQGEPNVLADIDRLDEELLLSDLIIAEGRLERIDEAFRKGKKNPRLELERRVLDAVGSCLSESRPLRELELRDDEEKLLRGFQFLTLKPVMVIVNSDEDSFGKHPELLQAVREVYPAVEFSGSFEAELSRLDVEEAEAFLEDMGVTESARARLAHLAYNILGYISFFTVGPKEVRAWTLRDGGTAIDAADTIHSDMARGFIRAECFTVEDIAKHGSEKRLRDAGGTRLEGKNYVVEDGDILIIRFNV